MNYRNLNEFLEILIEKRISEIRKHRTLHGSKSAPSLAQWPNCLIGPCSRRCGHAVTTPGAGVVARRPAALRRPDWRSVFVVRMRVAEGWRRAMFDDAVAHRAVG
jgi:hypothetical protein